MTEFLAYAKAKPNELTCATAGIGTAHYLYGQVLNKVAGISLLNVPYRGTTPAFNDLLGGHVPAAIVSLATALPQLANNQVRLLTMFDTKRYAKAPDVPAITEVLPQFEPGRTWIGFVAPRNLPGPIIARLHDEIVKILRMPEVVRILEENGLEIIANEPNEFATMIREDSKIWVEAAVIAGLITQ